MAIAPNIERYVCLVLGDGTIVDGSNGLPTTGGGGGGGGAVTMAAGAVVSGAYVAGSLVDGAIATLGFLADAAVGDASGSVNAHMRQVAKILTAGVTLAAGAAVIGAVTQSGTWNVTVNTALPAGTNTIGAVTGPGAVALATDRTTAAAPFAAELSDGAAFYVGAKTGQFPTALVGGRLDVNIGAAGATVTVSGSGTFTTAGAKTNNNAAPGATNVGSLSAIANAAAPSWTEGNLVAVSTDLSGNQRVTLTTAIPAGANTIGAVTGSGTFTVAGAKTNNNAAPGATNVGTLSAVANAAVQTWTEGNQVALSTDLSGILRIGGAAADNTALMGAPVRIGISDGTNIQTWQQAKVNGAAFASPAGLPATAMVVYAGAGNYNALQAVSQTNSDAITLPNGLAVATWCFNGTNFDRQRSITSATGTTGTGIPAVGNALWDLVNTTNFVKQAGDGSGRAMVVGAAAAGSSPTGNPVLMGVQIAGGNVTVPVTRSNGLDGIGTGDQALIINGDSYTYNGASWDRQRSNVDVTLLASAGRTTTQTSADIVAYNCRGIMVTLDVTTNASGSITLTINYKDPASGKYILLLSGLAVASATGTFVYTIHPDIPSVANVSAQKALGRIFQVVQTANNANSVTSSRVHIAGLKRRSE